MFDAKERARSLKAVEGLRSIRYNLDAVQFLHIEGVSVLWRLALLFIGLPTLELFVLYLMMNLLPFGMILTVLLIVGTGLLGASLAKYQGLNCWLELHRQLDRGETPTQTIANGILILLAGVLLIMPGLLTDLAGILLLIPPIRRMVIADTLYRFEAYRHRMRPRTTPPQNEIIDV